MVCSNWHVLVKVSANLPFTIFPFFLFISSSHILRVNPKVNFMQEQTDLLGCLIRNRKSSNYFFAILRTPMYELRVTKVSCNFSSVIFRAEESHMNSTILAVLWKRFSVMFLSIKSLLTKAILWRPDRLLINVSVALNIAILQRNLWVLNTTSLAKTTFWMIKH